MNNSDTSTPALSIILLDLRNHLEADARRLISLWGNDAVHALIGKPAPPKPGFVSVSLLREPWDFHREDIRLDTNPAAQLVQAMYAYAFEFQHPIGMDTETFSMEVEQIEDFANDFHSELFFLFLKDTGYGDGSDGALRTLCKHTRARLSLDRGELLALEQLALLARMNERSVKNAFPAGLAIVENDDARRWLAGRREFTPTRFTTSSETPGEHPERIGSLIDLGRYLDARWAGLSKTAEKVAEELDWSHSRVEYLRAITAEPHLIDPRDCEALAKSLLVSSSWFTEQVLRLLFPEQMALLLDTRATPSLDAPDLSVQHHVDTTMAQKIDISTRLMFVLQDGTRLYPVRMKNRESKKVAFRLSPGGAGGNTLEAGKEIESEQEMIDLVTKQGYAVRMTSDKGGMKSLYKPNGRSIRAVYLDGELLAVES